MTHKQQFEMFFTVPVIVGFGVLTTAIVVLWWLFRVAGAAFRYQRAMRRDRREARHAAQARQAAGWANEKTRLINPATETTQLLPQLAEVERGFRHHPLHDYYLEPGELNR